MSTTLMEQQEHLSSLLVAVQRSAWFLQQSADRVNWPITSETLTEHRKDVDFFETLAAVNERFAKLQDILASTMRHAAILAAEPTEPFLKVLTFYEKIGVLSSVSDWQESRMIRNIAAHEYDTDEAQIAEHFNAIHALIPMLIRTAKNIVEWILETLSVLPASTDFAAEFNQLPHYS